MSRRIEASGSIVPFDKSYAELTEKQKDLVKSQYVGVTGSDEPPFPAAGLAKIYRAVHAAQRKRLASGLLSVLVEIDASGAPVSAAVYQTPDPELGKAVASLLLLEMYKPGICDGQPCAMTFPFRVQFGVREAR
jgi:hypothetical protein